MPTETLHWVDWSIIIIYMALIAYLGNIFAKRGKSTSNYFKGNKSIPSWAIGISVLATLISSVTFLAYPGQGFDGNWILLVQGLAVPITLIVSIWFIVPLYRRFIGLSAYEYFEKRFGFFGRIYSSVGFSVMHFTKMGTVLYLMGLALAAMTGQNTYLVIIIVGAVTIIYTLVGGIEGVIWMDVIQGLILFGGGIVCFLVLLFKPEQGPIGVMETAWESGKMSLGPYAWDFTQLTFFVMAINGVFYALQKYGTDQTIVQRFLVARSDKEAVKAALTGAFLCVPLWTLFILIGTLLWVFYGTPAGALPEGIAGDEVFPYFIMTQIPVGVTGLIIAALFSAAMSSLNSDLNCLAAVGVEDYYKRFKKNLTDKKSLRMGKLIILVCGILSVGFACLYVLLGGQAILGTVFGLYAIFSGGVVGIFLLGILTERTNRKGLNIGIIACILFTAYALLTSTKFDLGGPEKTLLLDLGDLNFNQHKYMMGVYSHLVVIVVGYFASFFFKPDKKIRHMTIYGWSKYRNESYLESDE
ncbi:sodium:solute symporter [Sedimentisphaera salicampi]|uniref:sodium:solute symporter n=1 Tax=Sedimentisphaera salicampi TaxID=1941349 RepID=UPI000B9A6646|nr:sodium:solute symporter [Sedimentisphaera salicampi]OXU15167.1 Na(+)/glucose symporter [Sedimentisphaera salicampi]